MSLFLPKSHGILGINARNLNYLKPFNPRKSVAFADDKLKTKLFLETRGIPVPKLYAKITSREELRAFDFSSLPDSFALKPNFGYGGEGILVFSDRIKAGFRTIGGEIVSFRQLFDHIEDILDGMYSLHHRKDTTFFEQLIVTHECFAPLNPAGLPDIRIVVFNLVPVMAMIRIPTDESNGKANLHLGGIGLGVDLGKGTTTFGVQRNNRIHHLPSGREISGFPIPFWDEMLLMSSRIQQITNIGFLGVDFTIDEQSGPLLLEVNARAGLMVQIANLAPLGKRLERIKGLKVSSPEKGVRIAQDLFGEKIIKTKSAKEKPVLATRETIEILGGKKSLVATAILRPDYDRTVFSPSLLSELEDLDAVEKTEEGTYRVKFSLGGKKIQTVVHAHLMKPNEGDEEIEDDTIRASIGRRDLSGFLVDPGKSPPSVIIATKNLKRIDKQLADIDRKILLLRHIRPSNLEEEMRRLLEDSSYNPVFTYDELSFDRDDLIDRLQYLDADASHLGTLLEKKRKELILKVQLLTYRGDNRRFTELSGELYGMPTDELMRSAKVLIQEWRQEKKKDDHAAKDESLELSSQKAKEVFEEVLERYGLRDWSVRIRRHAVADCSIGRKALILREGAKFSQVRLESLVAHEIETHVLTSENGERQPYEIFQRGCAGYLETQEGLAIINQNRVLPKHHEKRYWSAIGVLAVHYGFTHSFAELRAHIRRLGFSDERALRTCLKVKRGMADAAEHGVFTKELVYFSGWKKLERYFAEGGSMRELYIGKVNVDDIADLRKIDRLVDPVYFPINEG